MNCSQCGVQIPTGQKGLCSVCCGDPAWGRDGYLQAQLDEAQGRAAELEQAAEEHYREIREQKNYNPGT